MVDESWVTRALDAEAKIAAALVVDHTEWEPEQIINGMRLALLGRTVSKAVCLTCGSAAPSIHNVDGTYTCPDPFHPPQAWNKPGIFSTSNVVGADCHA